MAKAILKIYLKNSNGKGKTGLKNSNGNI